MSTTDVTRFLATWAAAEQAGDPAAVGGLLTDDFVGIGPLGFALPKDAWVGRLAAGDLHYDVFALHDVEVRDHGDAALVTATHTAKGDYAGNPLPESLRASLVLVRRGGEGREGREGDEGDWQLAGVHLSFIAGTPGAPRARN